MLNEIFSNPRTCFPVHRKGRESGSGANPIELIFSDFVRIAFVKPNRNIIPFYPIARHIDVGAVCRLQAAIGEAEVGFADIDVVGMHHLDAIGRGQRSRHIKP